MFLAMMAITSDDTSIVLCLREDFSMILLMYACMMLSVSHSFFARNPGVGRWRVCMSLPLMSMGITFTIFVFGNIGLSASQPVILCFLSVILCKNDRSYLVSRIKYNCTTTVYTYAENVR